MFDIKDCYPSTKKDAMGDHKIYQTVQRQKNSKKV